MSRNVLGYDQTRTCLIFSNPATVDIIYVSDQPGITTDGVVIPTGGTVVLGGKDGWDVKSAHYAYSAAGNTLIIGTGTQLIVDNPPIGDGLPHPNDPPM